MWIQMEKDWAQFRTEALCLCVGSLTSRQSDDELHGFVCTAFSVVIGNRKSLLLITGSNGL